MCKQVLDGWNTFLAETAANFRIHLPFFLVLFKDDLQKQGHKHMAKVLSAFEAQFYS